MNKTLLFALALAVVGLLPSCQSTGEDTRPRRHLANPGDELDTKSWNRPHKASHVGTPFGMPTSN